MFRGKITRLAVAVGLCSMAVGSITWIVLFLLGSAVAPTVQPMAKLIIDTDAGIDDAVALFLALTDNTVDVKAITCVKGNTNVDNVVINVLKILRIVNKSYIPVYAGNNYGLMTNLEVTNYFGVDGLGDVYFPNPPSIEEKQKGHAAVELVRMVTDNPGEITLICLGPLTNLALAISLNPEFLKLVRRVIILGGTIRGMGNQSPGVEFNFYSDPDAASLVLDRASLLSQTVTILPIEPVSDAKIDWSWRWDVLAKINSKVVDFMNTIERADNKLHPNRKFYKPYDSCAVAIALAPGFVVTSQLLYTVIDPFGKSARGAVLIDYYNTTSNKPNVDFIMEINASVLQQRFLKNFENYRS